YLRKFHAGSGGEDVRSRSGRAAAALALASPGSTGTGVVATCRELRLERQPMQVASTLLNTAAQLPKAGVGVRKEALVAGAEVVGRARVAAVAGAGGLADAQPLAGLAVGWERVLLADELGPGRAV